MLTVEVPEKEAVGDPKERDGETVSRREAEEETSIDRDGDAEATGEADAVAANETLSLRTALAVSTRGSEGVAVDPLPLIDGVTAARRLSEDDGDPTEIDRASDRLGDEALPEREGETDLRRASVGDGATDMVDDDALRLTEAESEPRIKSEGDGGA